MKKRIRKHIAVLTAVLMFTALQTPYHAFAALSGEPYVKGDLTGDNSVRLDDTQLALRIALGIEKGSEELTQRGDIDGDGRITLKDTQQILKAALGIIKLDNSTTVVCEHEWVETTEHFNAEDEKEWGITEEAWENTIEESAYICNGCGKIFRHSEYGSSSNAGDAHSAHVYVDKCSGGYHTDKVTTLITHNAKEGWIGVTVTSRTCTKCNEYEEISRVPDAPIKH